MLIDLFTWLEATRLATWTRESPSIWAYPTVLTLHTVGLAIVVGVNAAIDLRLLGVARRVPLATLMPAFSLIGWGFLLNAATGLLLLIADATMKMRQPVLYVKLSLIALGLWCTLLARREMGHDRSSAMPGVSLRAAGIGAVSLLLWAGAITAGRLMAYL